MSESNQHFRIASLLQEIIEACKADPTRIEVAVVNLQSLINAMKLYERAPRYFNAVLEEAETPFIAGPQNLFPGEKKVDDPHRFPIVGELEKIYGRKLKQTDLQKLGSALSSKTGVRLDRDTKRSKMLLLQWFHNNWAMLHQKIYEYNLHTPEFLNS